MIKFVDYGNSDICDSRWVRPIKHVDRIKVLPPRMEDFLPAVRPEIEKESKEAPKPQRNSDGSIIIPSAWGEGEVVKKTTVDTPKSREVNRASESSLRTSEI